MNLAELAIRNKTTTLVLSTVFFVGGIVSFNKLPRLEDPEFTIKEALVITPYPGATAAEVETEVSDKIEKAVQQLGQLKEVESKSDRGMSTVTVRIKDRYDKTRAAPGMGRIATEGGRHPGQAAARRRALDCQRRLWRRMGDIPCHLRR